LALEFGDGTTSSEQNPSHIFPASGDYYTNLLIYGDSCNSEFQMLLRVEYDTSNCNSNFNITLDTLNNTPNTYIFTDLSEGNITSWYWEFGDGNFSIEQNPIHKYTEGGTYYPCLSITSLIGNTNCLSTECKEITTLEYFNFGGQAFIGDYPINIDSGDNANIATAYLYRKINHSWHYMDQREFWEYGYYWFVDKPVGEYLILADLSGNSIDYDYYAPSYYPNATSWKNASSFILSNNQQFAVNISLHELAPSTSGIGSISGMVIGGTSCDTNYNITTNHVLVQLFNSSNELILYTYTNADGNYEFTGLGMSNYYIKPEYTGKYTDEINITLSDAEPNLTDIQLIVNCSHPLGVEEILSEHIEHLGIVYPNPLINNGDINITLKESSNIKITIFNQFGQILYSKDTYLTTGNHIINFGTETFIQGIYFVKITTEDNISTVRKFIKTR
jgi:PKD repeat protein